MRKIDCSKFISEEIIKNCTQWDNTPNGYDYIQFSEPRTFMRQFFWFKPKEYTGYYEIFEIIDESIIRILEEHWDKIMLILTDIIQKFEIETGQKITVEKVNSLTQFSDY